MMGPIVRWVVTALAVLALPSLFSGVHVEGFGSALAVALVLGLLNAILKPVLIFLTLPLTLVTLGFFILVINGLMLWITSHWVNGFTIDSFGTSFLASLFVSLVSWAMSVGVKKQNGKVHWHVERAVNRKGAIDLNQKGDGRWE